MLLQNYTSLEKLQIVFTKFLQQEEIKGTVLIAQEGVNGTVAGREEGIDNLKFFFNLKIFMHHRTLKSPFVMTIHFLV